MIINYIQIIHDNSQKEDSLHLNPNLIIITTKKIAELKLQP